ncbi:FKBP-type peptidyl-prolyl cis-trans isomerase [Rhizomicrobium palustre]|uniref:Peptidyl-prolyl cis-trans isomerase n=1 Tax=Rhizomicrobium palustre TaxID=189966 RepID=A0A846N4D3_9PROT|nr:FKBP-type peptidyl-prolyl cis-trans isomerase [Rhizomicrobium palustre]NIK90071.1 FKBP-type peptidyl-prolyl cis-trans isomerase [Rhizomicrobium palustre]
MRRGWMVAVLALAFVGIALAGQARAAAADPKLSPQANQAFLAAYDKKPGVIVKPDGLRYRIITNGFGRRPRLVDYVTVYYTGKLINGKVFDGTEEGMPVRFKVNSLISGWAEALSLMKVGDKWEIVIPGKLGYGEAGTPDGSIPPNQTLVFEVELKKVTPPRLRPADPNDPDDKHAGEDLGPDDGK